MVMLNILYITLPDIYPFYLSIPVVSIVFSISVENYVDPDQMASSEAS